MPNDPVRDALQILSGPVQPAPEFADRLFATLAGELQPAAVVRRPVIVPLPRLRPNWSRRRPFLAVSVAAAAVAAVAIPIALRESATPPVAAPARGRSSPAATPPTASGPNAYERCWSGPASGSRPATTAPTHPTPGVTPPKLAPSGPIPPAPPDVAADTIVYASDRDGLRDALGNARFQIYAMSAAGTDVRRVTNDDGNDRQPVWSPDQKHIAFVRVAPAPQNPWLRRGPDSIFIVNADGSGRRRLTSGDGPEWSPDGTSIVFFRRITNDDPGNGSPYEVFTINVDGTGEHRVAQGADPVWSPDGTRIAFANAGDARNPQAPGINVYTVRPDGTGVVALTTAIFMACYSDWSPDGAHIAYVDALTPDAYDRVGVMDPDGRHPVVLTDGSAADTAPSWSPDGRWIVYEHDPDGDPFYIGAGAQGGGPDAASIWLMHPDGTGKRRVSTGTANDVDPSFATFASVARQP
jgi:Tol biopolymer transport system component